MRPATALRRVRGPQASARSYDNVGARTGALRRAFELAPARSRKLRVRCASDVEAPKHNACRELIMPSCEDGEPDAISSAAASENTTASITVAVKPFEYICVRHQRAR
jgi:hypothetical protein